MKNDAIKRSVRSQRFSRTAGDAPNIGRVARVPGTGMPRGARRQRKRGERRGQAANVRRRTAMIAWSSLIFVIAFAILGLFLWAWLRGQMNRRETAETEVAELQSLKASKFQSPSEDEAMGMVKTALKLRDPIEILAYFHPGQAEPQQIVSFLAGMERNDGAITGYQWLSSMDANGLLIDGVVVNTMFEDQPKNRLALLTPDETGVWKIDFEAFSRTVRPSWEIILSESGGSGLIRVMISKDTYYNGPFRDDQIWSCYRMASPDVETILLGYCRNGSPQELAMQQLFPEENDEPLLEPGSRILRATLEVKRPPGAEARQFQITRVLAEDWVLSDVAFDGSAP